MGKEEQEGWAGRGRGGGKGGEGKGGGGRRGERRGRKGRKGRCMHAAILSSSPPSTPSPCMPYVSIPSVYSYSYSHPLLVVAAACMYVHVERREGEWKKNEEGEERRGGEEEVINFLVPFQDCSGAQAVDWSSTGHTTKQKTQQ